MYAEITEPLRCAFDGALAAFGNQQRDAGTHRETFAVDRDAPSPSTPSTTTSTSLLTCASTRRPFSHDNSVRSRSSHSCAHCGPECEAAPHCSSSSTRSGCGAASRVLAASGAAIGSSLFFDSGRRQPAGAAARRVKHRRETQANPRPFFQVMPIELTAEQRFDLTAQRNRVVIVFHDETFADRQLFPSRRKSAGDAGFSESRARRFPRVRQRFQTSEKSPVFKRREYSQQVFTAAARRFSKRAAPPRPTPSKHATLVSSSAT